MLIPAAAPVIVAAESHLIGFDHLRTAAWLREVLSFLGLFLAVPGEYRTIALGHANLTGNALMLAGGFAVRPTGRWPGGC